MAEKNGLNIIEGGGKDVIRPKRQSLNEDQQIVCPKCNGSATVSVTLSPRRTPKGKQIGGSRVKVCAFCMGRGEIVELVRG